MSGSGAPLRLLALGGLGEIGRNLLTLEHGDDIVVVDCGLMFPEAEMLGVDLVIPDVSWLVERRDRVRGIVLTHGHEDHIGALPYVLPRLDVPVYGTDLALGLLRNKLREHRLLDSTTLRRVQPGDTVDLGSISVEWIHTTHSVPDACALALHTPLGVVVHSGDFKVDQAPVHGEPPDLARLARLGDEGVLLLLSDSTNADVEGMTPSESTVGPALRRLIDGATGRVLVATFASNISRLQQAIAAAEDAGRRCLVIGRSMVNNLRVAQELGFLTVEPGTLVSPRQAERIPDRELCILCTGAQGEPLSALTRIASAEHPLVRLRPGDTVVLSANPIPGNEEAVHRTLNNLHRLGARVHRGSAQGVHTSGHAGREELRLLLTLCRPQHFLPVHGEYRHLAAHRELAVATGVAPGSAVAVDNGAVVELDGSGLRATGERVAAGYVYVDGVSLEHAQDIVFRDRRQLAEDGLIIVHVVVERSTGALVAGPELICRGLIADSRTGALIDEAQVRVHQTLAHLAPDAGWVAWQGTVHEVLRRFLYKRTRRRPLILPLVTEV